MLTYLWRHQSSCDIFLKMVLDHAKFQLLHLIVSKELHSLDLQKIILRPGPAYFSKLVDSAPNEYGKRHIKFYLFVDLWP